MEKIIAFILSLIMLTGVTTATAIDSESIEKGYEAYNELTAAITIEMQQGWEKSPEDYGISDIFAYNNMSTFGYLWIDLDGNGVDELILGEASVEGSDTPIYDLFSITESGELNHVLTGWERNRWYTVGNGILLNEGSSGYDDSFSTYYEYKDGTISEIDTPEPAPEPLLIDYTLFVDVPVIGPGGINPWHETDAEGLVIATGISFNIPESADNVTYRYMFDANEPLAEATFTLDGLDYTARMKPTVEFEDISGLYYDWTVTDDCMVDYCPGQCCRFIGDGYYVDVCLWFDVVPGMMYSVSTSAEDLDGFDIEGIAEEMFVPLQGEVG